MRWSFPLGTVAGIHVRVHATFFLLLVWVAIQRGAEGGAAVVSGIGYILAVFGCVVLHELGHALAARRYGIRTPDITLLPIGGVARLERMPTNPGQEFVVAVAGPAVNVLIAAGLFVVIQLTAGLSLPGEIDVTAGSFMARLLSVNVALVLFNLIPAFPMDGGRILRSLIALKLEYARATSIAASLGQAVALVFGFIGFFGNPFLILIAVFVWMGAAQESNMAQMQAIFRNVPVRDAMLREYHVLAPEDTLARAVELVLATSQQDFPVVGEGRVLGIVTWNRLQPALTEHGEEATVDVAMTTEFETAEENDSLEEAVPRLQQADCKTMPVLRDGAMVGIVTMGNIGELMAVRSARRTRG